MNRMAATARAALCAAATIAAASLARATTTRPETDAFPFRTAVSSGGTYAANSGVGANYVVSGRCGDIGARLW